MILTGWVIEFQKCYIYLCIRYFALLSHFINELMLGLLILSENIYI